MKSTSDLDSTFVVIESYGISGYTWPKYIKKIFITIIPDNKVLGANMGPIWGRQDPDGSHVGRVNFAIGDFYIHQND